MVLSGVLAQAQTVTHEFGSGAYSFSMEFVTIGNPNNPGDTTGSPNPVGSVPYVYNLGKYEVSRDMVLKASTAGGLGLTVQDMASYGGNGLNRPATGISWNEAARFVNWLNASKGYAPAYNFSTTLATDTITVWAAGQYSGINQYRHKNAYYFLPSLDEWYKGAYGSPSGIWYNFPTGSNSPPTSVSGGTAPNTAVYDEEVNSGPADITNAGGLSAFGTMAQGGNVSEWLESAFDGSNDQATEQRGWRGGAWFSSGLGNRYLDALDYGILDPISEGPNGGFRVAMIPEPSSLSLLLAGGVVLMAGRRRRLV
jgi:hypothetical protein